MAKAMGTTFVNFKPMVKKRDLVYCTLRNCHETSGVSDRKHTDQPRSVCMAKLCGGTDQAEPLVFRLKSGDQNGYLAHNHAAGAEGES